MIPILYAASEKEFTSNGLGRLSTCTECKVTEERNGLYECEFVVSVTDKRYSDCIEGNIVSVTHDETGDRQPFVIYRRSAPIDGMVTVNAHHISYGLNNVILKPFDATSAADAFGKFETETLTPQEFTFWTDVTTGGNFSVEVPTPVRAALGGSQGSILDVYGGEYLFDKYLVRLYANRGNDNGVTIRYGKNLVNINAVSDSLDLYNAVVPYWTNTEGAVIYGGIVSGRGGIKKSDYWTNENGIRITNENNQPFEFAYYVEQVTTMDLSSEFQEQPTIDALEARAQQILNNNEPWVPLDSIKVDFAALWQTDEYKDVAPLERVRLCDSVSVVYSELGISAKAKVIKVVWDVLEERYSEIELGKAQASFAQVVTASTEETIKKLPTTSMMQAAINHATALITGGLGGHIVYLYDANGFPTDMLIMDTDDVNTAVNVLRINVNGIGFSHNGISGPFTSAWTLDGAFVADFITAGELSANRIKGGALTLGGAGNGNGILQVVDANGNVIGTWTKDGVAINDGSIDLGDGAFEVTNAGAVTAKNFTASDYIYVDGGTGSLIKIPMAFAGDYVQLFRDGFELKVTDGNSETGYAYTTIGHKKAGSSSGVVASIVVSEDELYNGAHRSIEIRPYAIYLSNNRTVATTILQTYAYFGGTLSVKGTKSRQAETEYYGDRLLYSYETPSPLFGDIGTGETDEDGLCYVLIDDVLAETLRTDIEYYVFLQKEGEGDLYIAEKNAAYFVVKGTPNLAFSWELKAKQTGYELERMESPDLIINETPDNTGAFEKLYQDELDDYYKELEALLYEDFE